MPATSSPSSSTNEGHRAASSRRKHASKKAENGTAPIEEMGSFHEARTPGPTTASKLATPSINGSQSSEKRPSWLSRRLSTRPPGEDMDPNGSWAVALRRRSTTGNLGRSQLELELERQRELQNARSLQQTPDVAPPHLPPSVAQRRRNRPVLYVNIPEAPRKNRVCISRSKLDVNARYSPVASSPFASLQTSEHPGQPTMSNREPHDHFRDSGYSDHYSVARDSSAFRRNSGHPKRSSTTHVASQMCAESRGVTNREPRRSSTRATRASSITLNKPLPPVPDEEPVVDTVNMLYMHPVSNPEPVHHQHSAPCHQPVSSDSTTPRAGPVLNEEPTLYHESTVHAEPLVNDQQLYYEESVLQESPAQHQEASLLEESPACGKPLLHEELLPGPSRPVTVVYSTSVATEAQPEIEHGNATPAPTRIPQEEFEQGLEVVTDHMLEESTTPIGAAEIADGLEVVPAGEEWKTQASPMCATLSGPFSSFEPAGFWIDEDDASDTTYAESGRSSVEPPRSCSTGRSSPEGPPPVPRRSHKRPVVTVSDHSDVSPDVDQAITAEPTPQPQSDCCTPFLEEIKPLNVVATAKAIEYVDEQKALLSEMSASCMRGEATGSEAEQSGASQSRPIDEVLLRRSIYAEMTRQMPPSPSEDSPRLSQRASIAEGSLDAITSLLSALQGAKAEGENTVRKAQADANDSDNKNLTVQLASIATALDQIRASLVRQTFSTASVSSAEYSPGAGGSAVASASFERMREVDAFV